MKKLLITGFAVAMGFGMAGASKASVDTVINFSGFTQLYPGIGDLSSALMVTLDAGTYQFTPVSSSTFAGALYGGAYSFGNGQWSGGYNIAINDKDHVTSYYPSDFPFDAATAFAEAFGGSFTLTGTSNVYFGVGDNPTQYSDNGGGISLHLTSGTQPVPEPETYAMMLGGLGLIGLVRKRRRKAG
ncbi:MAG TPA: PEP-CTERM sorting domain-containing protein [Burkholderiales bacterium]|nr:PEP-CTERM sorting domain-containing protein [Burkholderiales bacterium]